MSGCTSKRAEGLALLELAGFDLGLIDRLDLLFREGLRQRVVHDRVHDVGRDLWTVKMREHLPRRLPRTEAAYVRLPLQRSIGLLHLHLHRVGRNFDRELNQDRGNTGNLDLHGDAEGSGPRTERKSTRPRGSPVKKAAARTRGRLRSIVFGFEIVDLVVEEKIAFVKHRLLHQIIE
jgi:hypothetical protein